MKGVILKAAVVLALALGTAAWAETPVAYQVFDRCWPYRYSYLAERELNWAFAPQVINGHILDQTVWNHFFEPGTDRLTPGGIAHLQYVARRRPVPDTTIYLATAMDLPYDPGTPDRYCGARQDLDMRRVVAIQKFLTGLNCGRPMDYKVCVHDPAVPSQAGTPIGSAIVQMYARFRGGLATAAGGAGGGGTGGGGTGR
jgi:hypothetical protein